MFPWVGKIVTFRAYNEGDPLPLPSRKYLAAHATCAKAMEYSGVREAIVNTSEEVDASEVLAYDGSSAHLLSFALSKHTGLIVVP